MNYSKSRNKLFFRGVNRFLSTTKMCVCRQDARSFNSCFFGFNHGNYFFGSIEMNFNRGYTTIKNGDNFLWSPTFNFILQNLCQNIFGSLFCFICSTLSTEAARSQTIYFSGVDWLSRNYAISGVGNPTTTSTDIISVIVKYCTISVWQTKTATLRIKRVVKHKTLNNNDYAKQDRNDFPSIPFLPFSFHAIKKFSFPQN